MIRSRGKVLHIESFVGINEVYAEDITPPGQAPTLGVIDNPEAHLFRLGGKLAALNCSTTHGRIMDLSQITFASSTYILFHNVTSRCLVDNTDVELFVEIKDGIAEYGL